MYAKADRSTSATTAPGAANDAHRTVRAFGGASPRIRYRSAVTRHTDPDSPHSYYDGGDLSPYSIESLLDLLRAESRQPYSWLELDLEINGPCTAGLLRQVTLRVSELSLLGLRVRIRAEGHPVFVLSGGNRTP